MARTKKLPRMGYKRGECNNGLVMHCLLSAGAPVEFVVNVFENCLFYEADANHTGYFIHNSNVEGRYIIYLSSGFFERSQEEKVCALLHETAHYVLDHRLGPGVEGLRKKLEKEADAQVDKWLMEWSGGSIQCRRNAPKPTMSKR